jgi:ribonucleoside-diphosphate reductase alpha chain
MRNATITTIAPTGTISIIAGVSSGIEPYFALAFYRNVMDNNRLAEVNAYFLDIAKKEGFYNEELGNRLAEEGSLHNFDNVPAKWRKVFVTSHEISPVWHVKMQAAFQKYTDNAVSKTVNFTEDATVEDVRSVYNLAYDLNCKGITIYRDGSRSGQVINVGTKEKTEDEKPAEIVYVPTAPSPRPRPNMLFGRTVEMLTGCGKMYVTINQDENGQIFEVFTSIGKAGGCAQSQSEAIGRLISLAFRSGIEAAPVISQLKAISCHQKIGFGPNAVLSCADAVAKALETALSAAMDVNVTATKQLSVEKFLEDIERKDSKRKVSNGACPDCGGPILYEEGCNKCYSCGFSQCS